MTFEGRAPDFPEGLQWLNTDRPLRFTSELRGQVVLLDFWTYCCINCLNVLPDLAYLEETFAGQPFVVIGVHSNKFSNEGEIENIRAATRRYGINHPVVADRDFNIWNQYAIRAWPSFVLVDPLGRIVGRVSGEGHRDALERAIRQVLDLSRGQGILADKPVTPIIEAETDSPTGLAFPGKVLADGTGRRLFIADTGHNRIVETGWPDSTGRAPLVRVYGNGVKGISDGPAGHASFNQPQGMALTENRLYVADTGNHLVRAIDLENGFVSTIAGSGSISRDRRGGRTGREQGLNSPWDLVLDGRTLYIAMAGLHQIWRMDLETHLVGVFAGSGRENIMDGPPENAELAQPSGLALLDGTIYFADSEVSAVRGVDLGEKRVFTVIGQGLFEFGDTDGNHRRARFQHPLGIAPFNNRLLVADTYNHKIKIVDPGRRRAATLYGAGRLSTDDPGDGLLFAEPGGLSVAGSDLVVADTNNHRIVRVDLNTGSWHPVSVTGLEAPAHPEMSVEEKRAAPGAAGEEDPENHHGGIMTGSNDTLELKTLSPVRVNPTEPCTLRLTPDLEEGTYLNTDFPIRIRITDGKETLVQQAYIGKSPLPLTILISNGLLTSAWANATAGSAEDEPYAWTIEMSYAYCSEGSSSVCIPSTTAWSVPLTFADDGESELPLD